MAEKFHEGKILVTTTRRLLEYCRAVREINYDVHQDGEILRIDVNIQSLKGPVGELSATDLNGLVFYVPEPDKTQLTVDGREVVDFKRNDPDYTGRPSVSLAWPVLEFPKI